MKLNEALPSLFRRPLPLLERGTRVVVAGTLLDTPRRDILTIVSTGEGNVQFLANKERRSVFSGYSMLVGLLESEPEDYYRFLFQPCERALLSVRPLASDAELATVLEEFVRTKFGWALVEEAGKYGVVALPDLIPLYQSGVLETDLPVRDVASPEVFSLPASTGLREALREMVKRRVRRVFLSGDDNKFVSDREVLTYIFSPERLTLARDDPRKVLDATLADAGAVEAIEVDGGSTVKEISRIFKPESGAWCLVCDGGLVTPWDLVMKPWKLGRLTIRETMSGKVPQKREACEVRSSHAFFEGLKKQGYSVRFDASLRGSRA